MNTSSNGFMVFNILGTSAGVNLNCTFANAAATKLTGLKELTGLSYGVVFDSPTGLNEDLTLGGRITMRFPQSGSYCYVDRSAAANGQFLCTICEIGNSGPELQRYQTRLWEDAEGVMQFGGWIWDLESQVMEWTGGLFKLMGYPSPFFSRDRDGIDFFTRHIHPQDLDIFRVQMERIASYTDVYVLEFRVISATGVEKHLYLRGENVIDEQTGRRISLSTIFDVSTLRLMQSELEQKVSDLNKSNSDLEQFAYVASHDLQEPLRKIVSFGERLNHKSKEVFSEEQQLYLDRILNATRRMQEMINNLLEFSRVSSGPKVYVSSDLNEILKSTLSDLEVNIQERGAVFNLATLPVIDVIPAQISQLFLNLISNSLKFTKPGVIPLIDIHCSFLAPSEIASRKLIVEKQYVKIVFQDNGIGFETSSAEKIFTIFQRLRGRSEFEGAGIGLAVCKKVVERHHGAIDAFGVPGAGATFEVVLPCIQTS